MGASLSNTGTRYAQVASLQVLDSGGKPVAEVDGLVGYALAQRRQWRIPGRPQGRARAYQALINGGTISVAPGWTDWPRAGLGGRRRARGMQPMAVCASRTRGRRAWSIALALSCAVARAADVPDQLVSFGDLAERDVFLEVSINGANTSQLLRFRDAQGRLSASADALRSVGIDVPGRRRRWQSGVAAGCDSGLALQLQRRDAVGEPDGAGRLAHALSTRHARHPQGAAGHQRRGLVLNYDAYAQTSGLSRLSLYTEQRYFSPSGVFSNTGITYAGGRADRYIRYDTYWTRSDQDTMRTLRLGDTITSSLDWSRSIRIAGVQWGRNFSLRPDLVTFPVAAISASSVVPSSIALYINGVQQYSSNVPAGPFVVNQIPGITGAGQATIVTRDALGRIATTVPLYVDTRLLARGLSSYSVEAGFVRRRFSVRSFDYDHAPAFSASGRYGLDDALTLEGHAERARRLQPGSGRAGQAGRGGRGQRFAGRQRGPLRGRPDQPGLPVRAA